MRNLRKTSILFCTLILGLFTACNFSNLIKKNGQVFLDFSGIAKELNSNSRSVIDSVLEPNTEYFIDLKIEGAYKLNATINLNEQSYYEIDDIPAGSRIKASIEVYKYNMNYYPKTKEILFTGESKPCVISSGENQIEIKLKANFKITFKIYVRYNAYYQNSNWENEPEENDGLTKDTGFYYIQSAINWIAANGNNKKDYEIVLTDYDQNNQFGQGFEFGENITYYSARSVILSSSNKDVCALRFNSSESITVSTKVQVIFNNITIQPNSSNSQILKTNSDTTVTLGNGTFFEGENDETKTCSAILINGGSVTMEDDAKISGFFDNDGAAVWIQTGNFSMNGRSSISNCHAINGNGGAVCMSAQTSSGFSISDKASITNCSATQKGGAIYSEYHSLDISGGSITGCSANEGGAIYLGKSSSSISLYLSGGEIKNNQATKGSAIYLAKDNQLGQMKAQLILSENACIDLSNDVYSEGQPIYLSGTLKIDKDKAARITYDSISGGKTILTLSERPSDPNAVTNSYSKFYVSDSNSTTHYYVSEQGQSVLFNSFITGDIHLGDIVFADNKRIRPADYDKIDYELYSSIAGIVFYSGTTDDLIGATNLIVGTKTYRNQFETSRHGNSGYTIFHTMDITNFPDNEDRWGGVDYTSCVSIEEAVFTCGKNSGNLLLNNSNSNSFLTTTIDTIHDIFTSINNNNSSAFPLYQQVLQHGQLFANSTKYKLNIDNIDNPADDDIITDNWYIPTIPELILFSRALKDSTFLNIYTKICGSPMESDYISQTALFTISSIYPDHYSNSSSHCFAYHFTINFSQNLIKCDSTDGYLYTIPVHVYEVN